jgi:hypothetical protein
MKLLQIACPVDVSVFCSRTSISPIGFVRSGAAQGSTAYEYGALIASQYGVTGPDALTVG